MVQVTGRAVASHALRAYVPGVIGAVGVVCFIFCRSVIEHPIAIVVLDGWIYEIITKAKYINPRNVIINIYLIIFAVLIILSELGFSFLLKRFAFLDTFFGRGIFYIFVGLLAVDTHWFQILAGVFVAVYGLVLVLMSFFVDDKLNKSPFSRHQDNPDSTENQHSATTDNSVPDRIQGTSNV